MLIRRAQLDLDGVFDLRIEQGRISELGQVLLSRPGETVIEAEGAALLPGLHDHHLHLRALSAALSSLHCGPPQVHDAAALAQRLREADADAACGDDEWIRGIGYHPSVAGEIDRDWLDRHVRRRPIRVQHRSGRMWVLNSAALARLGTLTATDPPERSAGRLTGRIYDADGWLRTRVGSAAVSLHAASRLLAGHGVTGVTDTTPSNDAAALQGFETARRSGELLQDLLLMGSAALDGVADGEGVRRGPTKFHLHDADLPDFDQVCAAIRGSHAAGRAAAFHCVTRGELVFALAALREVGAQAGDRIEHAGIAAPEQLAVIAELGLIVVTQPNFVAERGDAYLRDVAAADRPWLYRLRGFADAGVALAGSTDAPFGDANPWRAMQAAVLRRSAAGAVLGADEALTPEQALALFLAPLEAPGAAPRKLMVGVAADLCLLRQPWNEVRLQLAEVRPRMTLKAGGIVYADSSQQACKQALVMSGS